MCGVSVVTARSNFCRPMSHSARATAASRLASRASRETPLALHSLMTRVTRNLPRKKETGQEAEPHANGGVADFAKKRSRPFDGPPTNGAGIGPQE